MKRKGIIAVIAVGVIIIVAMIGVLASNKHKINEAKKPIDRTQVPVTVTSFQVLASNFTSQTTLPAKLRPFEEANISVQTPGLISYLNIDLGSKVSKGQIIGSVDTKIANLNLKSTLLTKNKLKDDYKRAKDLYEGNATTEVNMTTTKYNYDNTSVQAEIINQQIENAKIIAPISGIITARNIKAGEFTNAGSVIASVLNICKLKATVFVDETEVYFISMNQHVDVVSPIFPDKNLTGKVIYISPSGDDNHNYQIDIEINNSPELLKAGTNVNVSFNFETKQNQILIPKKALVNDKKLPYVYVITNNIVSARQVQVGISQGESIVIVSGLMPGEKIVVSGQINLSEGSKVNVVKQ
jgi:RND family efflux transporter, MFP subunit